MTYGFEVRNNNGDLLVNDTDFNWGLKAEGSLTFSSIGSSGYATQDISNWNTLDLNVATHPPPLIFFRAPASRRRITIKMDTFLATQTGNRFWAPTLVLSNETNSSNDELPVTVEYKVYALMNAITPSGDTYGLIVYDQYGTVTFDSRIQPALVKTAIPFTFPVWDGNYNSDPSGASIQLSQDITGNDLGTPWICSTDIYSEGSYAGIYYTQSGQRFYFDTTYRTLNNCILREYIIRSDFDIPYVGGTPLHYNNTSGKTFQLLTMKGTSTALTPFLQRMYGTSSCTGTGCTTSETFSGNWTGGNSNAVTVSWELLNQTSGNFSLSGSGTNMVTVNLTNVGTGTYTATLRMTLSQSGSSSVTADYPISRTHTAITINNPLAINNQTYTDIEDLASTITLTMLTDGTYSVGGGFGQLAAGNWLTPTTAGIGSSYWVRFVATPISGSPIGTSYTATTSWLQLNSSRSVTVTATATTTISRSRNVQYVVSIATDSDGSNVVSTTTVNLVAFAEAYGGQ